MHGGFSSHLKDDRVRWAVAQMLQGHTMIVSEKSIPSKLTLTRILLHGGRVSVSLLGIYMVCG